MSDNVQPEGGPTLAETVREVQGRFPNDAALQDALSRLAVAGFDRSEFSLIDPSAAESGAASPDAAQAAPTELDARQIRTMASGLSGAAVGTGVAAVLASGVAAPLVAVAAVAGAMGVSAVTSGAGVAADEASSQERDRLGANGKLILAVRVGKAEQVGTAEAAMREAGASEVREVQRVSAGLRGVSASSWTGMS